MRNPYEEGYKAYCDGKDVGEYPADLDTASIDYWCEGWLDARNEQADDFFKDED